MMQGSAVDRAELARRAAGLGAPVPGAALEPLGVYLETLCRWNAAMNLVGARTWQDILRKLVADSLHLAPFLEALPLPSAPLCWDLGAGAGLPGLPLRMVWTPGDYVLVEAREKRALFLSTMLARLRLPRTRVFRGPAERLFRQGGGADLILSRAFLPWPRLLDLALPQLRPGGMALILAQAGPPARLPPPWRVLAQRDYPAAGGLRHFWALAPGARAGWGA